MVNREAIRIPDFLLYWNDRADQAVMVEVDSDPYHGKPSQRERDELKEREFESMGFGYLRFAGISCLERPQEVWHRSRSIASAGMVGNLPRCGGMPVKHRSTT